MKKAFIVLGPESSGTRLVTKILIEGGCQGDAGHKQDFDTNPFCGRDPIVWRRSVPHDHQPLELEGMLERLSEAGYRVTIIVIVRDWSVMERSQLSVGHVTHVNQARENIKNAYLTIFDQIISLRLNYVMVSYESLVLNSEEVQKNLFESLGLSGKDTVPVTNENEKWFENLH